MWKIRIMSTGSTKRKYIQLRRIWGRKGFWLLSWEGNRIQVYFICFRKKKAFAWFILFVKCKLKIEPIWDLNSSIGFTKHSLKIIIYNLITLYTIDINLHHKSCIYIKFIFLVCFLRLRDRKLNQHFLIFIKYKKKLKIKKLNQNQRLKR